MPAARAMIGEICANVRVITVSLAVGLSNYVFTTHQESVDGLSW
jgi:hypothetical protein